tara:strand:- start:509 stop:619 length:111 start_codon:yes stop_codon:yes gene_type:complete
MTKNAGFTLIELMIVVAIPKAPKSNNKKSSRKSCWF